MEPLYYESHVTIEPIKDEQRLNDLKALCSSYKFKVADLLMVKDEKRTRSNIDTFCTSRGQDLDELVDRMKSLVNVLHLEKYEVWRYKIEIVVIDVKL